MTPINSFPFRQKDDAAPAATEDPGGEESTTPRMLRGIVTRLQYFFAIRKERKMLARTAHIDRTLIRRLRSRALPHANQLRYFSTTLSGKERPLLKLGMLLILAGVGIITFRYIAAHVDRVPKVGGRYTEAIVGLPQFINPILETSDADKDISSLIFSGLLAYDVHGELTPDLARDYTVSEDGKVYTFALRNDVVWHDGQPFTADDVLFTIESMQDPLYKSPRTFSFRGITVKKLDDFTVQFTLEEPFAPFITLLSIGVIPKHIWEHIAPENAALARANIQPIGTGPYRALTFTLGEDGTIRDYTLSRSQVYYGTAPYIDKLVFKFYPSFEEAIAAVKQRSVEGVSFVPQRLKSSITAGKYLVFHTFQLPQYTALFFNQEQQKILADKNLRIGLAHAIDKDRMLREAVAGEGQVIHSPILPGYVGYDPSLEGHAYDVPMAEAFLDKTEWKRMEKEGYAALVEAQHIKEQENLAKTINAAAQPPEGTTTEALASTTQPLVKEPLPDVPYLRVNKDGKPLVLTLTLIDTPINENIAYLLKDMWGAVGIQLEIRSIAANAIRREILRPRDYEILLIDEVVGFDPDPYVFWHSNQTEHPGLNFAKLANRHVDELLEQARQTNDRTIRAEKYQEFQKLLIGELPAIFLYTPTYTYLTSSNLEGIAVERVTIPANRFSGIANWYVKTQWVWK